MRVAHILRKYDPAEWGGTETAIHFLTSGLADHGVPSVVFAPALSNSRSIRDPLAEAGCTVRRFRAVMPIWGISAERRRQLVAVGGNLLSPDLPRQLWRESDVDVIHSHALGRLGATARLVARSRRTPFVLTVHGGAYDLPAAVRQTLRTPAAGGWDWGKFFGMFLRARRLFSYADAIVTCNQNEAKLIQAHHPERRVMVQPHGVSVATYACDQRDAARHAFPRILNREVLLMPGRIDPVKNQGWLIEQLGALVAKHPRILLVLAGAVTDQAYAETLRAQIEREGLASSVLLAGQLPSGDPRLIGLMQEARAILLPSLSETFGLVILEAWAAGTPVLSSRTSGALALIRECGNGFLFSLDRPDGFHAAVNLLLNREDTRSRVVAAGRECVKSGYDMAILAERMKTLYASLLKEKKCAPSSYATTTRTP